MRYEAKELKGPKGIKDPHNTIAKIFLQNSKQFNIRKTENFLIRTKSNHSFKTEVERKKHKNINIVRKH